MAAVPSPKPPESTPDQTPDAQNLGRTTQPYKGGAGRVADVLRDTTRLPSRIMPLDADARTVGGQDAGERDTTPIDPAQVAAHVRDSAATTAPTEVTKSQFSGFEAQKESMGLSTYEVSHSLICLPNPPGCSVDVGSLLDNDLKRMASALHVVSMNPRVYGLVVRGERSVPRTVEAFEFVTDFAAEHDLPTPSIAASSRMLSVTQTQGLDDLPADLLKQRDELQESVGLTKLTPAFARLAEQPRQRSYVDIQISGRLPDGYLLANVFKSRLKLIPGGSKNQYFRHKEMGSALTVLEAGLTSGAARFITLEAALQMGKSRMIYELTSQLRAKHPNLRDVFVPQKDHDANYQLSYARAFARVVLEQTRDVAIFSSTPEYAYLAKFVENPKAPVEVGALTTNIVRYLSRTAKSGINLFITPDDLHWIDPASVAIMSQVFAKKNHESYGGIVGAFAARTGDQPMPKALIDALGVGEETGDRIFLHKIQPLDQRGEPTLEFKTFVLDLLGYNVTKINPASISVGDHVLMKLSKLAQGNPGKLTGTVVAMKEAGVLKAQPLAVAIDEGLLEQWENAGMAASAMVNKVDRYVENPDTRIVLSYITVLSEIGGASVALLQHLFEEVLKAPHLYKLALDLVPQEILTRSGDTNDSISMTEKDFADLFAARVPAEDLKEVYARVMISMHELRGHFQDKAIIPQNSAYNIYRCADKAGVENYKKHYCLPAFAEACERRDYKVILDIYDYVKTNKAILGMIPDKSNFYLHVLDAMHMVGGEKYLGSASKQGEELIIKKGELEILTNSVYGHFHSELFQQHDHLSFEKFCDIVIMGYYRRHGIQGLNVDSAQQIMAWSQKYSESFRAFAEMIKHDGSGAEVDSGEMQFLEYKSLFHTTLGNIARQDHKKAQSDLADTLIVGLERILNAPGNLDRLRDDPRFQKMYAESLRFLAVSYMNTAGRDLVELSSKYGVGGGAISSFDDPFSMQQAAATSPNSHAHAMCQKSFELLQKFFDFLDNNPGISVDQSMYNLGLQNAARVSTFTGKYHDAWQYYREMRTRASNSEDVTAFAGATSDASIMLAYLVRNLQTYSPEQNPELWVSAQHLIHDLDLEYEGKKKHYTHDQLIESLLMYSRTFAEKSAGISRSRNKLQFQITWSNQIDVDLMRREHALKTGQKKPEIFKYALEGMDLVDEVMTQSWGAPFYAVPILARYALALLEDVQDFPEGSRDLLIMFVDKIVHEYKMSEQGAPVIQGRNVALMRSLNLLLNEIYKMNRESMPDYVRILQSKLTAVQQLLETYMEPEERAVIQGNKS